MGEETESKSCLRLSKSAQLRVTLAMRCRDGDGDGDGEGAVQGPRTCVTLSVFSIHLFDFASPAMLLLFPFPFTAFNPPATSPKSSRWSSISDPPAVAGEDGACV